MEENLAKPREGMMSKVAGWIGVGIGFLVGRYSGLSLLIPLGGAFLFKKQQIEKSIKAGG